LDLAGIGERSAQATGTLPKTGSNWNGDRQANDMNTGGSVMIAFVLHLLMVSQDSRGYDRSGTPNERRKETIHASTVAVTPPSSFDEEWHHLMYLSLGERKINKIN
jgi:hypothetical protein